MLDDRDDVRSVPASGTFGVVSVNRTSLECLDGLFNKAGFVECVGVDQSLDVVLITNAVPS